MSRRIARHFGTMQAVRAAEAEAIQQVEGIGPEKARLVVAELIDLSDLIDKLIEAGANMTEPGVTVPRPVAGSGALAAAGVPAGGVSGGAPGVAW